MSPAAGTLKRKVLFWGAQNNEFPRDCPRGKLGVETCDAEFTPAGAWPVASVMSVSVPGAACRARLWGQ